MEIFFIILLLAVAVSGAALGGIKYSEFKKKTDETIVKLKLESQRKDGFVDENKSCMDRISKLEKEKSQLEQSNTNELRRVQEEKRKTESRIPDQIRKYAQDLSSRAETYETSLVEQLREYDDRLSAREKIHETRLSEQKQSYQTKFDDQEKKYEGRLSNQEKKYEGRLSEQEKKYESRVTNCETKLSNQEKSYEERLLKQKQGYETQISDHKQTYENELEMLRATYKEEITNLTKGYEEKIAAITNEFNKKYSDILGFCNKSFVELVELAFRYRPPLDRNKEKFMSGFRHLVNITEFARDSIEPEFKKLSEYIYLMGNERIIALSKTSDMGLHDFINVFTDRISETNVENLGEDDKKRYIVFFNTLEDFLQPIEKRVTHFDRLPHENQRLLVLSDLRRLYRDQISQLNKDYEEELITDEEKDNAIDMIEEFRDLEITKIRSTIEMA